MRILLFMGHGHVVEFAGGAEKVLCNMANAMNRRGHCVTVVCNDRKNGLPFYPLENGVNFVNLDGGSQKKKYLQYKKFIRELTRPLRKTSLRRFFPDPVLSQKLRESRPALKEVIERTQPEVIVSYFLDDHYIVTQTTVSPSCPLIVMHHSYPDEPLLKAAYDKKESLRRCSCLQLLLPGYVPAVKNVYPHVKTEVIPNVILPAADNDLAHPGSAKNTPVIVTVGRLERHKQPHILIEAFALLAKAYPQWNVHIYGGEHGRRYALYLRKLIRKEQLQERVFLMGTTKNVSAVFAQSAIFAFPSAYEGFPLALGEAMAAGLPCIGLKSAPGVNELITDGYNGLLADGSTESFAEKLKRLMDDAELRSVLGCNGREYVKQFDEKIIWDRWERLLTETVGVSGG
ncbi:MAG: glycosyltransferase [Planctomycetaceae bacterium]|jgi:glycosyltransferase involved in cell wall biosynthesis|nr:glycosyltransferase [Planctomycetaceae bacterium]